MKKLIAMLALLVCQQTAVHAHAVVTDHSLKITTVHSNHAETVSLDFNSKIEIGLSQIFLVSKGDQHTLLNIHKGDKQGQLLVDIPALSTGDYALKMKVFAADGHLTEDLIHFTVTP